MFTSIHVYPFAPHSTELNGKRSAAGGLKSSEPLLQYSMSLVNRSNLRTSLNSLERLHNQIQEHTRVSASALTPQAMTEAAARFRALMMVRRHFHSTSVTSSATVSANIPHLLRQGSKRFEHS
jgi:hypothetical protein